MFDRKPESRLGDIGDPCTVVVRMAEGDEHEVTMQLAYHADFGGRQRLRVDWVATTPIPVGGASLSSSLVPLGPCSLAKELWWVVAPAAIVARVSEERARTGFMPELVVVP